MINTNPITDPAGTSGFRIFSEAERSMIPLEFQGFMISLSSSGLISAEETEILMERLMAENEMIWSLEDLKNLVSSVLYERLGPGGRSIRMIGNEDSPN
ncbi:MAG: DUF494 family protein [Bacteroidetes bacterium]|nr:DUF494 family protein [Bacteroidota bacterium]